MNQWNNFSWMRGHVNWLKNSKDYINLNYFKENFNDYDQVESWQELGHQPRTGSLYDMRYDYQPTLTTKLTNYVERHGLEYIGVSYYRMDPGDNLPVHSDSYSRYITLFDLMTRRENIIRYIFFPQDRQSGHIFEIDGNIIDWKAGDYIAWRYDTPHLAANLGSTPRYSIQVTGILRDNFQQ